ncbi:MAG: hypothetical protein IPH08_03755 [Rhodocyclaceae bacterium]|nr:hypothetical protein [Rhodocyclaceae bacterium]
MTAATPPAARDAGVGERDAGGGAAFVEAVDAFARATRALERADISDPLLDVGIERVDTARARLLALHAAAVQAERERADAAEALAERAWAKAVEMADKLRAIRDELATTPPTLVHGGPPTDGLDDGR